MRPAGSFEVPAACPPVNGGTEMKESTLAASSRLGGAVMSTVVSVLPDTYGVKYKKTASVYLKRVSVQRQLTEARLLLLSFSAPIPHVLNSSSRISNPMKYWKDVVCRRVAMRGM